ncbi:TetR/AcrR family transcriptional regulator [Streptomyces sp. SPB074]|uniref:TetR/AcrR family transcriptional regulator n=1 Tax=Streptomyces sp. (strain SPB074) TaxID=465543 RepID=UPI0001D1E0A8|nr:TetR/AcrR family transcriptional regulator [Streptomyces sp. SPB074]EFG65078.1 TetR-family transcriptional regulator [Streptomyces sp. SPB074]
MRDDAPAPVPETARPEPGAGGGRRERQRRRRRSELYEVALGLFVERGYAGTTMEDIADRADVARATVFNHFPRKAVFLQEWARRRRAVALEAAYRSDAADSSLRAVLLRYFGELGKVSEDARDASVAMLTGSVHATDIWRKSPLAAELAGIVSRSTAESGVEPRVDAERLGRLLSGAYFLILITWVTEDPAPFDITDEVTKMVDTVLYGALPDGTPPDGTRAADHASSHGPAA